MFQIPSHLSKISNCKNYSCISAKYTLQETNISPQNDIFEDDFAFSPRWDMLVSWRVNIPIPRFPYRTVHGDVVKAEAGPSYAERKARREEEFTTDFAAEVCGRLVW